MEKNFTVALAAADTGRRLYESGRACWYTPAVVLNLFGRLKTMASLLLYALLSSVNSRELQLLHTWNAVCWVESRGDPQAVGDGGAALGIGQIHKILVDDCNRIVRGRQWSYADRLCPVRSFEMFQVYCLHYYPDGGPEQWARAWNGGPAGPGKRCTLGYWRRVEAAARP